MHFLSPDGQMDRWTNGWRDTHTRQNLYILALQVVNCRKTGVDYFTQPD